MANETPSSPPPPFMANAILNFHFDFPGTSLKRIPVEDFSKVWPHEQCVVALPSQPRGVLICLNPRK